jgi:hypothetical protein
LQGRSGLVPERRSSMCRRVGWALAVVLVGGLVAQAQEKSALPRGPAPRVVSVIEIRGDVLLYRDSMLADAGPPIPDDKEKPPAGARFVVGHPVYALGLKVAVKFPLATGTVYDTAGQKVSPDDVRKRLKAGDTVFVCPDGKMADAAYVKAFAKDVLLLAPPPPPLPPLLPGAPGKKDKP